MTSDDRTNGEPRIPIGEALPGIEIHPIDARPNEEIKVKSVFVLIKYSSSNGTEGWSYRTDAPPNREELLGALRVQMRLLEDELLEEWR